MSFGASLVLFAIGAILTFGINASPTGLDLDAIGVILMIVGVLGGLISAMFLTSWAPFPYNRTVVRDRHVHDAAPEVVEAPPQTVVRERREIRETRG